MNATHLTHVAQWFSGAREIPVPLTLERVIEMVTGFIVGDCDCSGTHLQGEITASRRLIESVFGVPTFVDGPSEDKVSTEWVIRFDDGLVATIYDWKRYEQGAPGMDEVYAWHIGGSLVDVVERVHEVIGHG